MASSSGYLPNPVCSTIRFLTGNIKGISNPIKNLKSVNTGITFLQETPLRRFKLKCCWVGKAFHSNFNSRATADTILINKRVPFSAIKVIDEKNVMYLIVVGTLLQNPLFLVSVYVPNFDQ